MNTEAWTRTSLALFSVDVLVCLASENFLLFKIRLLSPLMKQILPEMLSRSDSSQVQFF